MRWNDGRERAFQVGPSKDSPAAGNLRVGIAGKMPAIRSACPERWRPLTTFHGRECQGFAGHLWD